MPTKKLTGVSGNNGNKKKWYTRLGNFFRRTRTNRVENANITRPNTVVNNTTENERLSKLNINDLKDARINVKKNLHSKDPNTAKRAKKFITKIDNFIKTVKKAEQIKKEAKRAETQKAERAERKATQAEARKTRAAQVAPQTRVTQALPMNAWDKTPGDTFTNAEITARLAKLPQATPQATPRATPRATTLPAITSVDFMPQLAARLTAYQHTPDDKLLEEFYTDLAKEDLAKQAEKTKQLQEQEQNARRARAIESKRVAALLPEEKLQITDCTQTVRDFKNLLSQKGKYINQFRLLQIDQKRQTLSKTPDAFNEGITTRKALIKAYTAKSRDLVKQLEDCNELSFISKDMIAEIQKLLPKKKQTETYA